MKFSLINIDNRKIGMDDYPDAQGFIIVFTCNHCPYAIAYEDRLKNLHDTYAPLGFPLIAINANDPQKYPQDSFENMKVRAEQKGFLFPYLFDETQEIATQYNALVTPHAFLLKRNDTELELVYQGAIDDNYRKASAVTEHFLENQLKALLANAPVTYQETRPIGCSIKWK